MCPFVYIVRQSEEDDDLDTGHLGPPLDPDDRHRSLTRDSNRQRQSSALNCH